MSATFFFFALPHSGFPNLLFFEMSAKQNRVDRIPPLNKNGGGVTKSATSSYTFMVEQESNNSASGIYSWHIKYKSSDMVHQGSPRQSQDDVRSLEVAARP